jgi:hypothetical protein
MSGLHVVAAASAVVLLGVAVLALTGLRDVRPIGATEQPETPDRLVQAVEPTAA